MIFDALGHRLGRVTSGTLGPTFDKPIAMAYLATNHATVGNEVHADVRGKLQPMRVTPLPFVAHRYVRTPGEPRAAWHHSTSNPQIQPRGAFR